MTYTIRSDSSGVLLFRDHELVGQVAHLQGTPKARGYVWTVTLIDGSTHDVTHPHWDISLVHRLVAARAR